MEFHPTASSGNAFAATLVVPFGAFGIQVAGDVIHELVFLPPDTRATSPDCALAERAVRQIDAWLEDPDRPFDLPLARRGTLFQRRVWDAITAIPRGETRQYAHLSKALGSAARAVGQACRANPFPLVIPCHRVVSATGIGGFAGASGGYLIDAKHWLLALEATR